MKKFFRRCKGAVTIFLVIILVPMLTCSAFFVDVSRISLAEGVAASAGDLALNTALTLYDSQLKELYGLFATTQDQDELFRDLKVFYNKSIVSYGVGSEEAGFITDQIMAQLHDLPEGTSDADDILNMKLGDFNAYIPKGGSLTNPDVLERQIVEFMKYRTPINTGLRFLSALNSFSSVSKETKLVDQRQSYYKEEERLNRKAHSVWENLSKYNNLVRTHLAGAANDTFFTELESKYKEFHVRTFMDLYETQITAVTPIQLTEKTDKIPDASGNEKKGKIWELESRGKKFKTFVDLFPGGYRSNKRPGLLTMQQWIVELGALYNDDSFTEIKTKLKALDLPKSSAIGAGLYDIQHVRQLIEKRAKPLKEYTDQFVHRYERYQEFAVAMIWAEEDALDFNVKVNGENIHATELAKTIKANYEEDMRLTHDAFQPLADMTTKIRNSMRTDPFQINGEIKAFADKANKYLEYFEKAAEHLKEAEGELKDIYDSLNGGDLIKKRNEWDKTSKDSSLKLSALAEQDRADIKDLKSNLDKDQVQELYNRISPLRQRVEYIAEQIGEIRYGGKFIGDIKDYETFEKILVDKLGKETLGNRSQYEKQLKEEAENSFKGLFSSPVFDFSWMSDEKTGLSLYGSYRPVFYTYLLNKYSDPKEADEIKRHCTVRSDEDNEGENLRKRMKENGERATDEEKEEKVKEEDKPKKEGKTLSEKDLPSKPAGDSSSSTAHGDYTSDSDDVAKSTSTGLAGMFSGVAGILKGSSEDLRDAYYVTDYLLSMFSFDTIKKEHEDKKLTTPIQTLRCHEINEKNNYHYDREVEYILYGGTGSENVTHAYSSIFAIRFGLNVVYAFTDMDTSMFALQVATPISAATMGIVPVPLIQATIQILLALVQSAIDLGNLARGKAVPIFHTKYSWVVTPAGLTAAVKKEASDLLKGAANDAVNWAADKLGEYLDKGGEEADKFLDENRDKIEKHISDTFDDLITRHANVAVKKMMSLIENALSDVSQVDPAKYVEEKLDEWLGSLGEDPTGISYIVKQKTVKFLKSKNYIQKSIDKIREFKDQGVDAVEEVTEKLDEYLNSVTAEVKKMLHEATDEIKKYKNELMDKVKGAMNEGAEELKKELEEGIDGFFGSDAMSGSEGGESQPSGSESTGISSLLSFRYSDYMRLFLLLGMFTNRTSILLRTADVIQLNVSMVTGNPDYLLRNAGAYLTVEAKVLVKPVLMPLPLFAETFRDPLDDTSWYSIDYKATRGY